MNPIYWILVGLGLLFALDFLALFVIKWVAFRRKGTDKWKELKPPYEWEDWY